MGKGKGSFDHWASRVAVSKVIFELKGDIHEQVARDAFRLAGNKMPGMLLLGYGSCIMIIDRSLIHGYIGMYEFVKKGDPAVVGITKLDGITLQELKRPRRQLPLETLPTDVHVELSNTPTASLT